MRLELSTVEAGLATQILGRSNVPNELWDEIGSTNDRAIEIAGMGAEEGSLVLARSQNVGRGRQGKTWVSPPDSGIYMSLLLRPRLHPTDLPLISLAAGVAVCQALEACYEISVGLKWVNDIVVGGKKLGGILAEIPGNRSWNFSEAANSNQKILPAAVILGVGLNVSLDKSQVPEELRERISSLQENCQETIDPNKVVSEFVNCMEDQYNHLLHSVPEFVLEEWRRRSVTLGQRIRASVGNETLEGLAEDINDAGALVIKTDDGNLHTLHAGEISIRLADGTYA